MITDSKQKTLSSFKNFGEEKETQYYSGTLHCKITFSFFKQIIKKKETQHC